MPERSSHPRYSSARADGAGERRDIEATADWDQLHLDPYSGVIYKAKKKAPATGTAHEKGIDPAAGGSERKENEYELYLDHSYLVFAVQTGFDSSQLDLAQETAELGAVLAASNTSATSMQRAADAMADSLKKLIEQVKERAEQTRQLQREGR